MKLLTLKKPAIVKVNSNPYGLAVIRTMILSNLKHSYTRISAKLCVELH